jgi:formaldehyde-activating enzyme involved in methanogenesis
MTAQHEEAEQVWYGTLQEAANAALDDALEKGVIDLAQAREVVFEGRKGNPIHEYRAKLRPTD